MNVIVFGLFRSMVPTLARLALGVAAVTGEAVALVYLCEPLAVAENDRLSGDSRIFPVLWEAAPRRP